MAGFSGFNRGSENENKSMNFVDDIYVTELFGELYFKESSKSSFLPQLSSDSQPEMETLKTGKKNASIISKTNYNSIPPPITTIDRKSGKPLISLKSRRQNGRLVIKIFPNPDLQHAAREGGKDEADVEEAAEVGE